MLIWMGVLFYASHQPHQDLQEENFLQWVMTWIDQYLPADKVMHFGAYGVLGVLGCFAMFQNGWINWFICTLYGISDEFHQSFIPGRSVEALDVLADSLGAGFCIILTTYFWAFFIKSTHRRDGRRRSCHKANPLKPS